MITSRSHYPWDAWTGGILHAHHRVDWLVPPTASDAREAILRYLKTIRIDQLPQYPAFTRALVMDGNLLAARHPGPVATFLWYPVGEPEIPPFAYIPILQWLFHWHQTRDLAQHVQAQEIIRALVDLGQILLNMDDLDRVLELITQKATELLGAERASLFLISESGNTMDTHISVRRSDDRAVQRDAWTHISVPRGRGIVWRSVLEQSPLLIANAPEHPDFYAEADRQTGFQTRSILCIPLIVQDPSGTPVPLGALELINKMDGVFDEHDRQIAVLFGGIAAPLVRLARAYHELEQSRRELEKANRLLHVQIQRSHVQIQELQLQLEFQKSKTRPRQYYHRLVGHSGAMQRVYELIEQVKDTDLPVLIVGESGTGKELVARAIHETSHRSAHRFVAINCAAIPETLMERELFGAEKGAFTGAYKTTQGLFEAAHQGTLMLDEIAELPLSLQPKLLRVLEKGEVRRLGSVSPIYVDVRVIAATHRDLDAYVREGRFREDLYYRLNVVRIELPPLRERKEDIPLLVDYFLSEIMESLNLPGVEVAPDVLDVFMAYDWPGNVRQLENEVRRMATLGHGRLTIELISPTILDAVRTRSHPVTPATRAVSAHARGDAGLSHLIDADLNLEVLEAKAIVEALRRTGGNKARAARMLGISRRTLYDKIARYGIQDSLEDTRA